MLSAWQGRDKKQKKQRRAEGSRKAEKSKGPLVHGFALRSPWLLRFTLFIPKKQRTRLSGSSAMVG